jgi:hypothetical protein
MDILKERASSSIESILTNLLCVGIKRGLLAWYRSDNLNTTINKR